MLTTIYCLKPCKYLGQFMSVFQNFVFNEEIDCEFYWIWLVMLNIPYYFEDIA